MWLGTLVERLLKTLRLSNVSEGTKINCLNFLQFIFGDADLAKFLEVYIEDCFQTISTIFQGER
jgi:hypothetical protein